MWTKSEPTCIFYYPLFYTAITSVKSAIAFLFYVLFSVQYLSSLLRCWQISPIVPNSHSCLLLIFGPIHGHIWRYPSSLCPIFEKCLLSPYSLLIMWSQGFTLVPREPKLMEQRKTPDLREITNWGQWLVIHSLQEESRRDGNQRCILEQNGHGGSVGTVLAMPNLESRQRKRSAWEEEWNKQFAGIVRVACGSRVEERKSADLSHWRLLLSSSNSHEAQPTLASFLWEVLLINSFITFPSLRMSVPYNFKVLITMESTFLKVQGYLPWNVVNKHLLNIQIRFNPNSSFPKSSSAPEWWISMEQHVPSPERLALAYFWGQQVGTGRS